MPKDFTFEEATEPKEFSFEDAAPEPTYPPTYSPEALAPPAPKRFPIGAMAEMEFGGGFPSGMAPSPSEMREEGSKPFVKLPRFDIKPSESVLTAVPKELVNVGVGIPEFFTSPIGIFAAETGVLAPTAVSGAFTLDMIGGLIQELPKVGQEWPKMTPAQKAKAVVDLAATAAMALFLGKKTIENWRPKPGGLSDEAHQEAVRELTKVAEEVPKVKELLKQTIQQPRPVPEQQPPFVPPPITPAPQKPEDLITPKHEAALPSATAEAKAAVQAAGGAPGAAAAEMKGTIAGQLAEAKAAPAKAGAEVEKPLRSVWDILEEKGYTYDEIQAMRPETRERLAKEPTQPAAPAAQTETPDASGIQETTEVHGDVRPLAKPASALPVKEGGERVQPQATGGLPKSEEAARPAQGQVLLTPAVQASGQTFTGTSHAEAIIAAARKGVDATQAEHVFLDAQGNILNRLDAAKVWEAATGRKVMKPELGLQSEDLKATAPPAGPGEGVPSKTAAASAALPVTSESGGVAAPPEAARLGTPSTVSVKGQEKPSAKMQAEVTKTAKAEGTRSAKDIKDELVASLEKAIEDSKVDDPDKPKSVTIDIPDDGTFTVRNDAQSLTTLLERAKKLKTTIRAGIRVKSDATEKARLTKLRGGFALPDEYTPETAKRSSEQIAIFEDYVKGLKETDPIPVYEKAIRGVGRRNDWLASLYASVRNRVPNPYSSEHVSVGEARLWLQNRDRQIRALAGEPPTPPAPGPGMGGLRPPQAGGPGAAASGDAPASPPQARAAGAAVEQGPVENRPHGPVSTIGLALNRARIGITDFIKGASGQSMPKTTRMSREAGEAGVRYASSRIAARPLAQTFVAHALEGTGVDPVKFGAALTEDNLQSIRESFRQKATELRAEGKLDESDAATAQADRVATLIGAKGSPFKTQEELWEYLERPEVKKAIAQHIQLWQEVIDPQYRDAANIDPDVELPSRGQLTGARVNLKAVLPDERAVAPVRTGAGYPSLTATFKKKSPFAIQAKGTGQTYDVNYGEIIANTFERQLEIANKNAFDRILVETGNAEIHRPGWQGTIKDQSVVGFPLKRGVRPITTKEGETIPISMAANIYVPRSIAQEYRFASNVDPRFRLPVVTGINNFLNKMALAGLTDFSVHTSNLMTALFNRPASGKLLTDTLLSTTVRADIPVILAKVFAKAFKDNQAQIAELSKIGAMRGSETAGFGFTGRILKSIDRATRLVLDDTYKSLVKEGLIKDTETNRREYVNQVGQYNRRLQGPLTRLLRDTGIGPFVTAGKTFNSLGVKMLTLSPGAPGANIFAASVLRGNVLSKWVGATVLIGALNYLITGYMAGRPGTPLGNVDTGKNDKSGKQLSLPLLSLIGLGRGLRVSGLRGAIESKRLGLTDADAIDAASRDIINSWVAPGAGPPIKAGFIGASGYQPAINVPRASRVVPPGESQRIENLKEALKEANPVVISAIKLWEGKSVPEIMSSQLPRFSLVPGKPESMVQKYPEIVSKAQGSAFIDDLIHEARRLPDAEKRAFLTEQIKRLPKDQQAHAWNEARRRRVFRSNLKPADLPK